MRLALVTMVSGLAFVAPQWQPQTSGVTTTLRGVSAVSDRIAWASGAGGTILRTDDGGATWRRLTIADSEQLDFRDVDGVGDRVAYAVSIGNGASRIYKTIDAGATSGIFSVAFRDPLHGIVVGGNYKLENDANDNAAVTNDGGRTWALIRGLSGFRSVVRYLPGGKTWTLLAVGPSGADYSTDDGKSWLRIEGPGFHTFSFAPSGRIGWATGAAGRIARLAALDLVR